MDYAREVRCRRAQILSYFGEKGGACKAGTDELCDVCVDAHAVRKALAAADEHAEKLVCVVSLQDLLARLHQPNRHLYASTELR